MEETKEILNLAVDAQVKGDLEKAKQLYTQIIKQNPKDVNALHLLGLVEHQKGNAEKSVELIKKAIELNPRVAIFYGNLGMVYDKLGLEEDSIKSFEKAIELDFDYPDSWMAYYNLGISYSKKREIEKAIEYYNKAIELNKKFYDAYWNKGLALLTLGRFEQGFQNFEFRFEKKTPIDSRIFDKPKWKGEDLNNKKILVLWEQGFGDAIQFARYFKLLKEKGAYVIFECKPQIKKLFQNIEIDELIEKGIDISKIDYDFYIHIMSLPKLFKTNLDNIPCKIPYLKADEKLAEEFARYFDKFKDKFKIGIVWQGNPEQENNKNRSCDFEDFEKLVKIPNVQLFSLQKGIDFSKLENFGVIDLSDNITDFADTAAIIENLDLIISVDTSVAHLAGAMGKNGWILLCYNSDWRWLLKRRDSPWYKTTKLFRQKTAGDWGGVFEEVYLELKKSSLLH